MIKTSNSLKGLSYLWGGTFSKGVDSSINFENLIAGDLLFFGRKAKDTTSERGIHVGMWIGDNKFVNSMGDVHISTFDKNDLEFNEYNYYRYLRTKDY